jgi:hypothetical protein
VELTFVKEEIPKITRKGGSGREAEPWETHLAPVKETPGESFRVWTYETRNSATSRLSTVRDRLTKATPQDNWDLKVRPVSDYRGPTGDVGEGFAVYVQYNGMYTPEQIAENAKKRQERSDRTKAARKPVVASEPATEQTAKERVAEAASKRKAS